MGLFFFFDFAYTDRDGKKDWIFSIICLISGLLLFAAGFFPKKVVKLFSRHLQLLLLDSILLMGCAIYFWSKGSSWIAASHVMLSGVVILVWIYLRKRADGEKIVVNENHIILPGLFIYRIVLWSELTNLIKRADLLTLDFKNNKILQADIINYDDINEEEFNQFCQQRLNAGEK